MCQKELKRQAVSLAIRQTQQFPTLHPAAKKLSANNDRETNIEGPRKIKVLVSALQQFDKQETSFLSPLCFWRMRC